jgi:hexosaminidase
MIKIIIPLSLLFCALTSSAQERPAAENTMQRHNLMPAPATVQFQSGRLAVDSNFTVAVEGHQEDRLRGGIDRAMRRLEGRIGLQLARGLMSDVTTATLLVRCQGPGKSVPSVDEDESYSLDVSDKQAVLKANSVVGALRGLETLLQLLSADRDGYFIPAVSIQDQPRFRWRGLLIDSCRHFQPVEVIKRNLDAMAAVKLNVLHWHLTEDQGFRIESKKYPKLHQLGSDGHYYTQEQAREIIAYARDRGIRVVPEFDMPGHATSWFVGHPELASAPGPYSIERRFGIMDPTIDPTREEVYKFLDGFLGEMAALFPDAYLHIGGDENNGKQWTANPQIQAFMKQKGIKDNHALQAYFNQRLSQILKKYGKRMMGWDEILHPDLPKDIVVHSWRGPRSLVEAAKQGYDSVLSSGFYIDLLQPAARHYTVEPIPANSGLDDEQIKHILGGEATMWGELVTPETIDSRIWPRTAAIAERLWSPRTVSDVNDMYRRLAVVSLQLEELGLTHKKNVGMMLRRMARTDQIAPLETLVSVIEPVKDYERHKYHPLTSLSPYTRLVDAANTDSPVGRGVAGLVDGLLADAPRFLLLREPLREIFAEWRDIRPAIDVMIERAPILREAEPLARDLSEIGIAGLEALTYLTSHVAPPAGWREAKLALLDQAAKPKAGLEFPMVPAIRELIIAAAEVSQLSTTPPTEWRARIKSLAAAKPTNSAK